METKQAKGQLGQTGDRRVIGQRWQRDLRDSLKCNELRLPCPSALPVPRALG